MAVPIPQEYLHCPVRTRLRPAKLDSQSFKMLLPPPKVLRPQRKMVPPVEQGRWFGPPSNDMQFLLRAQAVPRPGKIESRPRNLFQPQNIRVKLTTFLHVRYQDCHMIEFQNLHALYCTQSASARLVCSRVPD